MARESPGAAVLLCDKPAGMTSHDVVAQVRRERGGRVGHAGTLDPFATGLLLVLLGRATRLQRYLISQPKTYLATARLGWRSSTGDPDGELTETGDIPTILNLPVGRIMQRVPMTSAVKIDGERLYKRAHRGESIETPVREVNVHSSRLISAEGDRATFEVVCSAGTYVRTLIETLGDAYCEELRRIAIGGDLLIENASDTPIDAGEALSFMAERVLDESEAALVLNGRALGAEGGPASAPGVEAGRVRLTVGGRLVAVARVEDDQLKPEVVIP